MVLLRPAMALSSWPAVLLPDAFPLFCVQRLDEAIVATTLLACLAALLLCLAACYDVVTRAIPDLLPLMLAVMGLLSRATEGWQAVGSSSAVALSLFILLLLFAVRGALGGGDVKLAAAMALGLSPAATWEFIFATVMIGGALGLAYLAGPRIAPRLQIGADAPLMRRILVVESWRLRRRGPVPYGVAIAGGGILVLLNSQAP